MQMITKVLSSVFGHGIYTKVNGVKKALSNAKSVKKLLQVVASYCKKVASLEQDLNK